MSKPVFFIALGAVAGSLVGMINGGGGGFFGREIGDVVLAGAAPIYRMLEGPKRAVPAQTAAPSATHSVFSACLQRGGASAEQNLRDLLEFHGHDETVGLVGCLLDGDPQRFCAPLGRRQAADAMELYFWSRDDAGRVSPTRGPADKIRLLDGKSAVGDNDEVFAKTWSGPGDAAIFGRLKTLVKQGYLDPSGFAFSGRDDVRDVFRDVKAEASPCATLAKNG